jgi:hypothetical protein
MADGTADNSAGTRADCGSLFRRRAGSKCADEGANEHNLLHHDITPSFFVA